MQPRFRWYRTETGAAVSTFNSALGPSIQGLLDVKHAIGLPYESSERHLRAFDALCAQDYPKQATLTQAMATAWVVKRPDEHVNGLMRRVTPVRQLAKHMIGVGIEAFVIPAGIPGKQVRYRPHLFSHEQLRALFDAADSLPVTPCSNQRHLIIPALFRMIYCLGLRPGEARRLHRNDVNLARGTLTIRESKGHKDRTVFMSQDLLDYSRNYNTAISAHQPHRQAFFPNRSGGHHHASAIASWFHELLDAAGSAITSKPGSPPRPYDLRHAHVIEVINRWARAGKAPEALIAYLSLHLGHANTADTWYYFHLTADFHADLRSLANTSIEATLPEARHDKR